MSIESFDPDQHRIDALTEGSGMSPYVAREKIVGSSDFLDDSSTSQRRVRVRRPLGRAVAEISGRDVSRMLANQEAAEHPLSSDERAEISRSPGHLAFLARKAELAYQHAIDKAGDDVRAQRVVLRKLAEDK